MRAWTRSRKGLGNEEMGNLQRLESAQWEINERYLSGEEISLLFLQEMYNTVVLLFKRSSARDPEAYLPIVA